MNARRLTVAVTLAALLAAALLLTRRGGEERPIPDAGAATVRPRVAPAPAPATARVAGTVRLDDVPVRGATVRLEIGAASLQASTDGFGHFEIGAVPVGSGTIEAAFAGATGDSRRLELRTPAGAREAERLELLLSACTDEIFGDVRDVAGTPLAGAEIRAANRVGRTQGRTVADGEGHYRLCVIPWLLGVRAQVAGYGAQLRVVRVAGSTRVDFRLGPEVILEGRVIDDDDEQPVAGALVGFALDWRDDSVRTDEAGQFHLAGLAPGRHRLVASAGDTRSTLGPVEVLAHVGVPVPPVVLRVGRSYLIAGRVEDGGGRAIAGERVSALSGALAGGQLEAVSDENGAFLLGPLPAGRTTLTLASEDGGEPREIVVPLDGEVVLRRRVSAWLRGRVMHERRPVAGAAIGIEGGVNARPQGRTHADGSFELGPIAGGLKLVVASHRELGEGTLALTVADGEQRDGLVVELSRGATVSGVVVDQRGAAVAGARVHLGRERRRAGGAAATGRDGAFTVTGLTGEEAYKVSVLSSSGMEQLEPAGEPFAPVLLDAAHRQIEGLRLAVRVERGVIGGVVRRATGEPIADATVDASDGVMTAVVAATVTDEQWTLQVRS